MGAPLAYLFFTWHNPSSSENTLPIIDVGKEVRGLALQSILRIGIHFYLLKVGECVFIEFVNEACVNASGRIKSMPTKEKAIIIAESD